MVHAYNWHRDNKTDGPSDNLVHPKPMGHGISLAVVIWLMQTAAMLFNAHMTRKANLMGVSARAAVSYKPYPFPVLTNPDYRPDLQKEHVSHYSETILICRRLSPRARLTFTNGHINTLITADAAYLERSFPECLEIPSHILVVLVACALLIANLGASALCGIGVLVIFSPSQGLLLQAPALVSHTLMLSMDFWENYAIEKEADQSSG